MVNVDAGFRVASAYADMVRQAFSAAVLPTLIPRLVTLCLAIAFGVLAWSAVRQRPDIAQGRANRDRGRWWARLVGAPWSAEPGLRHFRASLWQLFRGLQAAKEPAARRAEPPLHRGFCWRTSASLDFESSSSQRSTWKPEATLSLPRSARRAGRRISSGAAGISIDLSGVGRSQVIDAMAAAMCVPVLTEPHVISFSPESYWKGESHRTCDRIGAAARLLEELAAAGVEQVIVVCPDSERSAPHRLGKPTGSLRSRVAEHLAAAETTVVRDAIRLAQKTIQGTFRHPAAAQPDRPARFRRDLRRAVGQVSEPR